MIRSRAELRRHHLRLPEAVHRRARRSTSWFRDLPAPELQCVQGRTLATARSSRSSRSAAHFRTSIALAARITRGVERVWKKHRSSVGNIGAAVDRRFCKASAALRRSHEEDLLERARGAGPRRRRYGIRPALNDPVQCRRGRCGWCLSSSKMIWARTVAVRSRPSLCRRPGFPRPGG